MTEQNLFNRRQFLSILTSVAATAGLSACGGSSSNSGSSSTSTGSADSISYALSGDPRSLDPGIYDDGYSAIVAANIYEGLYGFAEKDTTAVAVLAEDLPEISEDGLTYTIKVRQGVKFHDGEELNADVVVKNYERYLTAIADGKNEDMPYSVACLGSDASGVGLASIEATDEYTVVMKLRAANTPFVKTLAMCMISPLISPAVLDGLEEGAAIEDFIGCGPYKFVSWTKSANIVLEAFEDYWDTENAPKTKNLVFNIIAEANTRITSLLNGESDIIAEVDPSSADQITEGGCELFSEEGMTINYMAFNTDSTSVCADKEVRKAIAQAINVEELVASLYGDYHVVANSILPTWLAPYCEDIVQTAYDPDAAKATLAAKGITSLECITYSTARPYNQKGGVELASTIQGYLNAVGVELNITQYDWSTYKTKVTTDPYDICFYGWLSDNGDPDNTLYLLSLEDRSMNVAHFANAEFNALIAEGLSTPEGDARDEIYHKLEELAAEEQPWLLISHAKNLLGYNPKVEGFYYHPTGIAKFQVVSKQA